jgi:hypothetical protein
VCPVGPDALLLTTGDRGSVTAGRARHSLLAPPERERRVSVYEKAPGFRPGPVLAPS